MLLLFTGLFAYACVISPALALYSWYRWARSKRRGSRKTYVSLAALCVTTCSFTLGIVSVAHSSIHNRTFLYLSPTRTHLYVLGLITASLATLVGIVGAFQPNPIRLKALITALGAVAFWFLAGSTY